jgi:hypothetical protein
MSTMEKLIAALAESGDLEETLKTLDLSAWRAARALASRHGQAQLAARRALARAQMELQARRHLAAVVHDFRKVLDEAKPEVTLKAAALLMSLLAEAPPAKDVGKPRRPRIDPGVSQEWLAGLAEVITDHRQRAAMGPPPAAPEDSAASA